MNDGPAQGAELWRFTTSADTYLGRAWGLHAFLGGLLLLPLPLLVIGNVYSLEVDPPDLAALAFRVLITVTSGGMFLMGISMMIGGVLHRRGLERAPSKALRRRSIMALVARCEIVWAFAIATSISPGGTTDVVRLGFTVLIVGFAMVLTRISWIEWRRLPKATRERPSTA